MFSTSGRIKFGYFEKLGFWYGSGSGIGNLFLINRVLSSILNLDRLFFGFICNTAFILGYNMWPNDFEEGSTVKVMLRSGEWGCKSRERNKAEGAGD